MSPITETVLSTLPATSENERVLVVLVQSVIDGSRLELRQQSFGDGIGWFTQSTVALEPGQVSQLRNALGLCAGPATSRLPREFSRIQTPAWEPRVVRADSA